jgi:hypothetical protein
MASGDWYEKHKNDVAAALKKGADAPKDQGLACALVKMTDGTFYICTHVSGSKQTAMVKEARAAGGKVVSVGLLFKDTDGPTFEVSTGDAGVASKFAAAAVAVGAHAKVLVKPAQDLVPATAADGATLSETVTSPAAAARVPATAADGATLLETAAATTRAPATTAIAAALSKLVPAVKEALAAHPERKDALLEPLQRCQKYIKDDKAVEAKAALLDLNRILKELQTAAPLNGDDAAHFKTRLLEIKTQIDKLEEKDPALAGLLAQAASLGQMKQFGDAQLRLDEVERRLKAAPEEEDADAEVLEALQDEIEDDEVSLVRLGKACLAWDGAKKQAAAQLKQLQKAILAEFKDTDGVAAVKNLNNILAQFNEDLTARVDTLINASGAERRRLAGEARGIAEEYLAYLAKSPLIDHVDEHPFDVKVTVRPLLQKALKGVVRQLGSAM